MLSAPTVLGADALTCHIYAYTSLSQIAENNRLECGEDGHLWDSGYTELHNWCLNYPDDVVNARLLIRGWQLNRCEAAHESKGKERFCNRYALTSVLHNAQNFSAGCNFSGPEWRSDYSGHYDRCLGAEQNDIDREIVEREELLATCLHSAPKGDTPTVPQSVDPDSSTDPSKSDWPGPRLEPFRIIPRSKPALGH